MNRFETLRPIRDMNKNEVAYINWRKSKKMLKRALKKAGARRDAMRVFGEVAKSTPHTPYAHNMNNWF